MVQGCPVLSVHTDCVTQVHTDYVEGHELASVNLVGPHTEQGNQPFVKTTLF